MPRAKTTKKAAPKASKSIHKAELTAAIAEKAGITLAAADRAMAALFDADGVIVKAVKAGKKVTITGFGTFTKRHRKARTSKPPPAAKNKKKISIPAHDSMGFLVGDTAREAINK